MHGGEITAHSDGTGHGAKFVITLPVQPPRSNPASTWGDSAAMAPAADEAMPLKQLRVIVVDDDPDSRSFIRELFEEYEAVVSECAGADEALRLLRDGPFGLMLCDIGMAKKDGYALMRDVRSSSNVNLATLPSIALTAPRPHPGRDRGGGRRL
jgi:CheY-like chemotaxis protein